MLPLVCEDKYFSIALVVSSDTTAQTDFPELNPEKIYLL